MLRKYLKPISQIFAGAALPVIIILITALLANAIYIINVTEENGDVSISGSGSLDLTAWGDAEIYQAQEALVDPSQGFLITQTGRFGKAYFSADNFSGPADFGDGILTTASSSSGALFGFYSIYGGGLLVPLGYTSNEPLSSSAIWNGASLASLGLDPGTYEFTWGGGGTGPADSIILNIGDVPESGSTLAMFSLVAAGLMGVRRRRR